MRTSVATIKYTRQKAEYRSGDIYSYLILTGKCFLKEGRRFVEAICDCGKIWFTEFADVRSGRTKSCGCKRSKIVSDAVTTHGLTKNGVKHPIIRTYNNMKSRCKTGKGVQTKNHGDRGITICEEWRDSSQSFYDWSVANGWREGLSLDRFPNNETGIYEPTNCRWATYMEQNRNKRTNVFIEAFGDKKCVTDWVLDSRCNMSFNGLVHRINILKWDAELAITTPCGNKGQYRKNKNG